MEEQKQERPYMIGIAGGSASGKTWLLQSLRAHFREDELCMISLDDYYHPKGRQQKDAQGIINFDLPEAIDHEALLADLQLLISGQAVSRPEYTFNKAGAVPRQMTYLPAPVIVVEGIFLLHYPALKAQLHMTVYMDSRDDIKLARRLARDAGERGIPQEETLYQWNTHVYPAYKKYLLPYKDEADIVLGNNYGSCPGQIVLKHHIEAILSQKKTKDN